MVFQTLYRFHKPKPIYMNIVRDPIERAISNFYYYRSDWFWSNRRKHFPDPSILVPKWLEKEFETCVINGDPDCVYRQGAINEGIYDHRRQMLFFCGHDRRCL